MSVFSPGRFIRRAALAAAAVFVTPMNAPANNPTEFVSAQPLHKIDPNSPYAVYFRDILTFIGKDLNEPASPARTQSLRGHVLMLQQGLNHYAGEHPDAGLDPVDEDGVMGHHTARNILRVIHNEKITDALGIQSAPGTTPADTDALKAASDLLATLQPIAFADTLRAVIAASSHDIDGHIAIMHAGLRQSFRDCTAWDRKSFTSDIAEREINQITAGSDYVSGMINKECARILDRMPSTDRAQAQMEYMNARIRQSPRDKDEWCKVRQGDKCLTLAL